MAPQASDDEFELFLTVADRLGLDPLVRQIYAIHRKSGTNPDGSDRYQMTIQTGIDGYRAIAEGTGVYAGSDRPIFETTPGATHPDVAIVTVWRFVHGQRCAFTAEARWDEYKQTKTVWRNKKPTDEVELTGKWADMPYNQLAKCAEALALRKGFPKQLSGIYVEDEMDQADRPHTVQHDNRTIDMRTGEVVRASEAAHEQENAFTAPDQPITWQSLQARAHAVGLSDAEFKAEIIRITRKQKGHSDQDRRNVALWLRNYEQTAARVAAAKAEDAAVTFEAVTVDADDAADEPDNGDPDLLRNLPALQTGVRP